MSRIVIDTYIQNYKTKRVFLKQKRLMGVCLDRTSGELIFGGNFESTYKPPLVFYLKNSVSSLQYLSSLLPSPF